jgi:hypothetical protein
MPIGIVAFSLYVFAGLMSGFQICVLPASRHPLIQVSNIQKQGERTQNKCLALQAGLCPGLDPDTTRGAVYRMFENEKPLESIRLKGFSLR